MSWYLWWVVELYFLSEYQRILFRLYLIQFCINQRRWLIYGRVLNYGWFVGISWWFRGCHSWLWCWVGTVNVWFVGRGWVSLGSYRCLWLFWRSWWRRFWGSYRTCRFLVGLFLLFFCRGLRFIDRSWIIFSWWLGVSRRIWRWCDRFWWYIWFWSVPFWGLIVWGVILPRNVLGWLGILLLFLFFVSGLILLWFNGRSFGHRRLIYCTYVLFYSFMIRGGFFSYLIIFFMRGWRIHVIFIGFVDVVIFWIIGPWVNRWRCVWSHIILWWFNWSRVDFNFWRFLFNVISFYI